MNFNESKIAANKLVLEKRPSLGTYLSLWGEMEKMGDIPGYVRHLKAAFLSSFTIQGLPEVFAVRGMFHNLLVTPYRAPYNQFSQEVLSPDSEFNSFEPDLIYVLIDATDFIDGTHLENILNSIVVNHASSDIIVATFVESEKADSKKVAVLNDVLRTHVEKGLITVFDFGTFLRERSTDDVWYSKYVALGDLRIAPHVFPELAEALLGFAVSRAGATRKCIVTDLDNTLWFGVVGEDGATQVTPNLPLQEWMLRQYERGTIIAINSKNNEADAMEVIERHAGMLLKKDHFAAWCINWESKDRNILTLAEELNIGTDSMVFVDDDLFQQNTVMNSLPEVAVLHPDTHVGYSGFFKRDLTEEDKRRGSMYAEERKRKEFRRDIQSEEDFLKKLMLEVDIQDAAEKDIERVSQLTQKTNQYNMTTTRHTTAEVEAFLRAGNRVLTFSVRDIFGEYGITGLCFITSEKDVWTIENFLMSCRIIGRHIEKAFLAHLIHEARTLKIGTIRGKYIPSPKNNIARNFFAGNGFALTLTDNDGEEWHYETTVPYISPDYIKVNNT